jgi:hypothetical protein
MKSFSDTSEEIRIVSLHHSYFTVALWQSPKPPPHHDALWLELFGASPNTFDSYGRSGTPE